MVLDEIARVTLGEFMDQSSFVNDIKLDLGLKQNDSDEQIATEDIGHSRISRQTIQDNLGLTFFITTGVMILIILLVFLTIFVSRRVKNLTEEKK